MNKTLLQTVSDYSRYRVVETYYDGRPARVLYGDKDSPQSGVALDDDPALLFDYNQRFIEIVASVRPHRVLLIGGGAFTLPTAIIERFSSVKVDVVELDPALPGIARDFFNLPDDPRLTIMTQDGRAFINQDVPRVYDLVIIDAFSEYHIPHSLLSVNALQRYKRLLKPGGIIALNYIAHYQARRPTLSHDLVRTFEAVFPYISLIPADAHYPESAEQNVILVAGQFEPEHLDYVQSRPVELIPRSGGTIIIDD
ncbi:MAG: Spermine synthase [Candidatus Saccharibacteria bacterium]|nr:Spermine synthase [Candidatus Saccharibacteria bacterium]